MGRRATDRGSFRLVPQRCAEHCAVELADVVANLLVSLSETEPRPVDSASEERIRRGTSLDFSRLQRYGTSRKRLRSGKRRLGGARSLFGGKRRRRRDARPSSSRFPASDGCQGIARWFSEAYCLPETKLNSSFPFLSCGLVAIEAEILSGANTTTAATCATCARAVPLLSPRRAPAR